MKRPLELSRWVFWVGFALNVVMGLACMWSGRWGEGVSPEEGQRKRMEAIDPAELQGGAAQGPIRVMRTRVYASDDFTNVLRWEEKFDQRVKRVNLVLQPALQVKMEVVDRRPWNPTAQGMEQMLAELEAKDAGDDVDWVVGLVGSLSGYSDAIHKLGVARILGRHVVLRGMEDLEEYKVLLSDAFDELPEQEREALYKRRKAHKESVVLLHELGHTLGAIHTEEPWWIMSGTHDAQQSAFADANVALMRMALSFRAPGEPVPPSEAALRELAQVVRELSWSGWSPMAQEEMLSYLERRPMGGQAVLGAPLQEVLAEAAMLAEAGDPEAGLELLRPLLASSDDGRLHVTACRLGASSEEVQPQVALDLCERAYALEPENPGPVLEMARMHNRQERYEEGLEALRRAQAILEHEQEASILWIDVASMYAQGYAITWTEEAARRAPSVGVSEQMLAWSARVRIAYGLPSHAKAFGVPPEQESAYIRWLMALRDKAAGRASRAVVRATLGELEAKKEWSAMPGVLAQRCELLWRLGRTQPAQASCAEALEGYAQTISAYWVLARMAEARRDWKAVATHCRQVIAFDPEDKRSWSRLAAALEKLGEQESLIFVRKRYEAQFGEPLP